MDSEKDIVTGDNLKEYLRTWIQEAFEHQDVSTSPEVEFYLVNLLEEFEKTENLFESVDGHLQEKPLAILWSKSIHADRDTKIVTLKHLGDLSLYMAGFFSDNIDQNKFVDLDYYISMGGGAYNSLSNILRTHKTFGKLFSELSDEFINLISVLSEISDKAHLQSNSDILRLYQRWLKTGDERIKEFLLEEGILLDKTPSKPQ